MPEERTPGSQVIRRGGSGARDAAEAVKDLAVALGAEDLNGMIFFCAPSYDRDALARALNEHFPCPVIGCTTAGEILSPGGYRENSLVGVGFANSKISFTPLFIPSLNDFVNAPDSLAIPPLDPAEAGKCFGLLLIDGLSLLEERVVAAIHQRLRGVPIIGGSAGDGLDFGRTFVYFGGEFHNHAAVLALFTTLFPFKTFHFQHFVPTGTRLVITEADVTTRTVAEINGLPAAEEYARIVGTDVEKLSPVVFAAHPVMLRVGGEYYVRSIQKVNPDGSLTFYCAIENGLVLTLATFDPLPESLSQRLDELVRDMSGLQLILGCDCILRRLELEQKNDFERIADVLSRYPFVGFSTYGEQYGGIHVNQTLTGLAIGKDNDEES